MKWEGRDGMMRWEGYGGVGREGRNGIGKEGCEGKMGREIQLTRFALPYDYTCFADVTSFE